MSNASRSDALEIPVPFDSPNGVDSETAPAPRASRSLLWATAVVAVALVVMMAVVAVDLLGPSAEPRTMAELRIADAQAAVKKKPKDFVAHLDLGSAYLEVGKDEEAIEEFRTAIKLGPDNYLGYYALANAYVVVGRLDAAVDLFEKAIVKVPENGALHYGLGDLHVKRGDYKAAAKALENAILVEPTASDSRVLLGQVYEKLDRKGDALEQYREALRYWPSSPAANEGIKRLEGADKSAGGSRGDKDTSGAKSDANTNKESENAR